MAFVTYRFGSGIRATRAGDALIALGATLLFLAFDVEMLFMYPWAVVVAQIGATAVVEMFLFLAALFVAVVWAWREGALRWV